jgi:RNA polymerase sigma-70 factor (ECF subfamily)
MPVISIGREAAETAARERGSAKLRERVTALFEEAREDVYRYLLTLGLHPPQAQEATQEVFLRLYATLRKGEKVRNPRAWVFRVAHNHGLHVRARQDTELPFDPELALAFESRNPDPEQQLAEQQRQLLFHRAVENLSEQQRRCLLLRLEGLRYPEIGAALGISVSAVGEFLRRAIERLRRTTQEGGAR